MELVPEGQLFEENREWNCGSLDPWAELEAVLGGVVLVLEDQLNLWMEGVMMQHSVWEQAAVLRELDVVRFAVVVPMGDWALQEIQRLWL